MASPNQQQGGGGGYDINTLFKPSMGGVGVAAPPSPPPTTSNLTTSPSFPAQSSTPPPGPPYLTPSSSYPPPTGPYAFHNPHYLPYPPPQQPQMLNRPPISYPPPSPTSNPSTGSDILMTFFGNQNQSSSDFSAPVVTSAAAPVRLLSSKLPKGRHLVGNNLVYDIDKRLQGEVQPQLEVTPITKYASDPGLVLGRQIAVNRSYICYGLKLGNIRILNINTALRSLLRGHTQRVTDMAFFAEDVNLLASASVEGRVFVWKIDEGPDDDDKPQILGKAVIAIQIVGQGESIHRVCWHPHKQEILTVAVGSRILKIDTMKVGKSGGFTAEEPINCPIDKLIEGVQFVGKHKGDITELSMCQWLTTRLASASVDGEVKIWDDRRPFPLAVLRPHDGQPVNSAVFLTAPHRPDHILLMTGGPLNREVKIWVANLEEGWLLPSEAESWKCTQTLELRSSETRFEDSFFNQVVALPRAGLFLLANAKKNAIYAVHIDYGPNPEATRMDYLAEFTVTMPILSLTGTSESLPGGEHTVQVYCVQTQAIQQYALDLSRCFPPPMDNSELEKTDSNMAGVFDTSNSDGYAALESSHGSKGNEMTVSSSETAQITGHPERLASSELTNSPEVSTSCLENKPAAVPSNNTAEHVHSASPPSPRLSQQSSGLKNQANADHGSEQSVPDYSVERRVDTTKDKEAVQNDISTVPNQPVTFKHRGNYQQKALFPSPQTPQVIMHKGERKYEVGKVTDEEQAKQRQLKAILNKLTPQNFDRLFEQVKAVNIDNAVTLTGVINQIFDKALMEPTFCETYANFCFHLAGELPDFSEDNEKITFKRLLLNKCQMEFERGEREQEEANLFEEEGEAKQTEEEREEKRIQERRRMLGCIRLFGELYKKKMLSARIMHECIKQLLGQYPNPDEEDIEALCKLMSTIREMIDHPEHMDVYFDMLFKLSNNMKLSSWTSEILSTATTSSERDDKTQDVAIDNDAENVELEVKVVGETGSGLDKATEYPGESRVIEEKKEKAFFSQASGLGIQMARDYSVESYNVEVAQHVDDVGVVCSSEKPAISNDKEEQSVSKAAKIGDSEVPSTAAQPPSAKSKKQKGRTSHVSGPSPSQSPYNSTDSSNEPVCSSGASLSDLLSQQLAMQDTIEQLVNMQKETQKQLNAVVAASVNKEGKRLETSLGRNTEKIVKANSDASWARSQEENAKREKLEKERANQITNLITNWINKDVPTTFEKILKKEIATVGPSVARALTPVLEKSIVSAINDSFQKGVGDKSVNQLEKSVISKLETTVARQIQAQFQTSGKQALQDSLRSCLEASVVPAFEMSCKSMFEQIDTSMQKGLVKHTSAAQQQFESSHSQLAITLRESINSATSITQTLSGELADGQRKLLAAIAAASANPQAGNALVTQLSNGPLAGSHDLPEAQFDPTKELSRLISERKYDEAFTAALHRSDVTIVSWLCSQVDLQGILSLVPVPLNQGVLLALLQQLACDINNETSKKLSWMTEVAVAINPSDPVIAMHVRPIFEQVYQILSHQRSVPTTSSSEASSIRVLTHVINSVLISYK